MKPQSLTVNQCISKLKNKIGNFIYQDIEELLLCSARYLIYQEELLKRLYDSANKIDVEYCTLLNNYNLGDYKMPEEYDKIWMDNFIKVEEYLKTSEGNKNG
jgi:hypothetical protein